MIEELLAELIVVQRESAALNAMLLGALIFNSLMIAVLVVQRW